MSGSRPTNHGETGQVASFLTLPLYNRTDQVLPSPSRLFSVACDSNKSRDMDSRQTILLLACISWVCSSSVHGNTIQPRRQGDVTPFNEENTDGGSSLYSSAAGKYGPNYEEYSHSSGSPAPAPSKEEGKTSTPAAEVSSSKSSSFSKDSSAGRGAPVLQETSDNIVTSGLRNPDAGDELLSTASVDALNLVKATASAAGARSVNSKVLKFCAITEKPDVCINSILPFIRTASSHQVDPIIILESEIQVSIGEAKKTIAGLAVISADPSIADQIATCKESYKNALGDLQDALKVVPEKDLGKLTTILSSAITQVGTCDDAFAEKPSLHSPMGPEFAARLKDLTDICLEIANKWVPSH